MKKTVILSIIMLAAISFFPEVTFSQDKKENIQKAVTTETVVEEVDSKPKVGEKGVLISKLKESGKTGLALLLISIIGFSFAFERLYNLRKVNIIPSGLAAKCNKLWEAGKFDELKKLAQDTPCTFSRIIVLLVDHKDGTHADVSNLAGDVASREMRVNLQRAYPLAVVATISPLLGLFGTVYGMIGAFESVALAGKMGDPSIMAGDIAYALITTALGLVIAVPALVFYHFFRIKTNILGLSLEEQVNHLIIRWFPIGNRK